MTNKLKKLPKHIMMMVEKGNLVHAIKNLASEANISMDEAKTRIDTYEEQVKAERQEKQENIAQKQAKKQVKLTKQGKESSQAQQNPFDDLNTTLENHLAEQGYKNPLIPCWWKRVTVIMFVIFLATGLLLYLFR